ncbi:At1g47710 [Linum grandiflorum]
MDFSIRVAMETILHELGSKKRRSAGDGVAASKNAVMSPASLDIVLRMVACGADGPTLEQLLSFLGAQDIEDLNSKASATMEALSCPPAAPPKNKRPSARRHRSRQKSQPAMVSRANAVWVDRKFSLSESFKKVVTDVYQADTKAADFKLQPGEAAKEINVWAKESTEGCIKNIVNSQDITPSTNIILVNALYFKARFPSYLFCPSETSDDEFHLIDRTKKVTVPFMNTYGLDLDYASFDDFKVLELPYESLVLQGNQKYPKFSMYIFLPHKRGGLPRMLRKHFGGSNPGEAFSQTLGRLEKQYMGKVHIPKWKFSLRCHLKETMKKLGLTLPFEFAEDFDKMFNERKMEPTGVSDVIQSAFIQVDEKGTVAAAVSRVVMMECKKPIRKPVDDFIADHPFMFLIVEKRSKAVIFAGSVVDPLQQ